MMRRKPSLVVLVLASLLVPLVLAACGGSGGSGDKVTLKFYHWIGADAGPVIDQAAGAGLSTEGRDATEHYL